MHGHSASDFDRSPEFEPLQWKTETVRLTDLPRLLHERQRRGFRLGRDDLFLTLPDGTEVKFCHEEDIHVQAAGGTAAELLRASLSRYGA